MSVVQYTRSPHGGPGTFIAVPAYDGISAPFVASLHRSLCELPHRLDMEIFSGNCHVDDGRNRLVRDFLETDCEQLVFLDVDVAWQPADLKKLIEYERDIVAGVYPRRADEQPFPVKPLPGERWSDTDGLVEVAGVPTGFLKVRRGVFETLSGAAAHHRSSDDAPGRRTIPIIFERALNGDSRVGGDIEFCRKARAAGFKVYVDPMMELGHQGTKLYQGSLGTWWRRHVAVPEGLSAIRAKEDTAANYLDMFGAWNNPYALSPEGVFAAVQIARRGGIVLECGSGLSTLCLGAATPDRVIALETMPMWASRVAKQAKANGLDNVHVSLCDTKEYRRGPWYDCPDWLFDLRPSLVLCDGIEDRAVIFDEMRDQIQEAVILVDDIARAPWRAAVDEYCASSGRALHVMDAMRPFGIIL